MVGWGQTPSHGCTEPESRVTDRMRDTADTHDRARIVNNATLTRRNRCVARTIAAADAAANPQYEGHLAHAPHDAGVMCGSRDSLATKP